MTSTKQERNRERKTVNKRKGKTERKNDIK